MTPETLAMVPELLFEMISDTDTVLGGPVGWGKNRGCVPSHRPAAPAPLFISLTSTAIFCVGLPLTFWPSSQRSNEPWSYASLAEEAPNCSFCYFSVICLIGGSASPGRQALRSSICPSHAQCDSSLFIKITVKLWVFLSFSFGISATLSSFLSSVEWIVPFLCWLQPKDGILFSCDFS